MISDLIQHFVDEHIESLEALELLVQLMNTPDRWWDAAGAAEALGIDIASARQLLERFASRNLLAIRVTGDVRYQYQPGRPDLHRAATAFAASYRTDRLAILNLVAGRPSRSIIQFADAFRIRK